MPLVTIVIPTYNRFAMLPQAVQSCIDQTWPSIEIVIIDDGSSDGTEVAVGELLATEWATYAVSFFRQDNSGASAARNAGISRARGKYIQFLDSDDILENTKIEKQVTELEKAGSEKWACCACYGRMGELIITGQSHINRSGKRIGTFIDRDPRPLIRELCSRQIHVLQTSAPVWRADFLRGRAGWREDIGLGDDLEYYCRLLTEAEEVGFVGEELFFVREHDGPQLGSSGRQAASFASNLCARRSVYDAVRSAGLWDSEVQKAFLGTMRTMYAGALELGEEDVIRGLESWLSEIASRPEKRYDLLAMIMLRRAVGGKLLLRLYQLLNFRVAG